MHVDAVDLGNNSLKSQPPELPLTFHKGGGNVNHHWHVFGLQNRKGNFVIVSIAVIKGESREWSPPLHKATLGLIHGDNIKPALAHFVDGAFQKLVRHFQNGVWGKTFPHLFAHLMEGENHPHTTGQRR